IGRHDLIVRFVGYEPLLIQQVLVTSGKDVMLEVELREQIVQGEEIVVTAGTDPAETSNEFAAVSARSFSVEETRRYAGGLDDPARMASAFAGITTGGGIQENAMIIRGNAPKGVQWRLEGVEIPNPSHFADMAVAGGGGLTLFSGQLLSGGDFFTGAFPAEYGNALAGVFDLTFRRGNAERREHALQVGLIGLEAASEGPFVHGRGATYLFNYRYSTLGLLLPILPTEDLPTYQDLSFKLSFPAKKWGRLDFWGIGGLDGQSAAATTDSTKWEYEVWDRLESDLSLGVGAAGISHDVILGRRSYLHSSVAFTIHRTSLDQQRIGSDLRLHDNLLVDARNARAILSSYLNHKFGARHTNRTGFSAQQLFYDLDLRAAPNEGAPLQTISRGEGNSTLLQAYSQSRVDLTSRLELSGGLHLSHFALTKSTTLEPRAGLRYSLSDRDAFTVGYGLHSQIEDLRFYLVEKASGDGISYPNRRLRPARAHHLVAGYERRIGTSTRVKLEGYAQSLFDVPVVADSSFSMINFEQDFNFGEALVNEGAGRNEGVELTVERFLRDGYYYLFTGSVFRSRYRGGDGVWRSTRFDRGYALNGLAGKEFAIGGDDLIGLSARIAFMGGKRRSPVDHAASIAAEDVVYDETRAFTNADPDLFVFDLTVTYRRNHRRFSDVLALQIKNLLFARDTSMDFNFATNKVDEVREGFPLPVVSYKVEF
ncbi:MAG TPA: TonB-dependent receptor, partial [Rhodothermales bacterium]